ncbi:MAG: ATP-binding protein [Selenomonadaceae bacterium]|nr:ATP-binding protein [Selenomonadaceae bacterium]
MLKPIGKVLALENAPSTIDNFYFWTASDMVLRPFDVVKVEHLRGSTTFGVVEEISHITDSSSFLADYISSDFGDVEVEQNTIRVGMNYVKAKVVRNTADILIPVHSGARVSLASRDEVEEALGLDQIPNPLVCGFLEMYDGDARIKLPVKLNADFLIGPEGAHLNISGISGLAAKTSYAMFLLKAIQDRAVDGDDSIAMVVFNVKGKDLLALDELNNFEDNAQRRDETLAMYERLGLSAKPFRDVKYYYPASDDRIKNTYVDGDHFKHQKKKCKAFEYKFYYELDKENLDLLFADVDDQTQTMESILNYVISGQGAFGRINQWTSLIEKTEAMCEAGGSMSKEISVLSWRKFYRLIKKSVDGNCLFNDGGGYVRLAEQIDKIRSNDVYVIDIARLSSDMQAFVFGNVVRKIIDFQLGDKPEGAPSKIIIFIDELNKFASTDTRQQSPILKHIIDIAERGRSLGIILFGADQFKSSVHSRVTGNCSTFAYGRTNSIELSKRDYRYIPSVYQNMMTRLRQGEYIIQNPIFNSLLSIKFPLPIWRQFK